jgi:hypothetical protein
MAAFLPMTGSLRFPGLSVLGMLQTEGERASGVIGNVVEPGYFSAMRISLLSGRDFTPADTSGSQPVAIVGQAAARQFWPGRDAVGKYVLLDPLPGTKAGVRKKILIVGVARDIKYLTLTDTTPRPFIYLPLQQQYTPRLAIVARTSRGRHVAGEIRTMLTRLNSNVTVLSAQPLGEVTSVGFLPQRVTASVSGVLGIVGLLLTSIGIYGVTAYAVSRRTREIGIRVALGAQRQSIIQMILRQGMSLVGIGVVMGLIFGAAAGRVLRTFLFGLPPLDIVTFAGAIILLALTGLPLLCPNTPRNPD